MTTTSILSSLELDGLLHQLQLASDISQLDDQLAGQIDPVASTDSRDMFLSELRTHPRTDLSYEAQE